MKRGIHNKKIIAMQKNNMALRKKYGDMCKKSIEMLEENMGAMIEDIENGNGGVVMRLIALMAGQFGK